MIWSPGLARTGAENRFSGDIELSILIVSYNTAALTLAAIRSVYATAGDVRFEVIVVDNASPDGSAAAIREAFAAELGQTLHLIASEENHGFARGNNIAAEHAKGTYLLLLNPDTVVLPGALQSLLSFARRRPEAGIWGGRTWLDDSLTRLDPASVWRRMSLWTVFCFATGLQKLFPNSPLFNAEGYGGWDRLSEREVDIVTGCSLLIDARLWRALKGFDRRFFMYAEEADLCLRARALGAAPWFTPDVEIVHYGGASESLPAGKIVKVLAGKMSLAEKHWPHWKLPFAKALYLAATIVRLIAFQVAGRATRRPAWRRSGETWAEVWARRSEWIRGYRNA
jgi:hypothetical protein